jgi:lipopolysaccharide export system protein LptA
MISIPTKSNVMEMWKGHSLGILNKYQTLNITVLLILGGIILFLSFSATGLSQNIDGLNPQQDLKKLHITADSLVASQNNQQVVFTGHVIALYELTTITSDKLQVFYSDQVDKEKINRSSVKKIIATGNVKIELEGKTAQCEKAVYLTSTNSLTLTGEDVRLQSEDSYITGNKITVFQNTGQIVVDGSNEKRVNAVFQPEEKNSETNLK